MDMVTTVRRNMVKGLVQRTMFCQYTGTILDMDTCGVVVDSDGDPVQVISPSAARSILDTERLVASLSEKGYSILEGGRKAFR